MGIDTERYIRKPLYVDAVRITDKNFDEIADWVPGRVQKEGTKKFIQVQVAHPKNPRQTRAYVGDWILWTSHGGHKVYTNKAFQLAFDKVAEEVVTPPTPIEQVAGEDTAADVEAPAEVDEDRPPTEELEVVVPAQALEDVPPPLDQAVNHELAQAGPPTPSVAVEDSPTGPPVDEPRLQTETGGDGKLKHEPQVPEEAGGRSRLDVGGKRVLSRREQAEMSQEEIRDLIRSGEVVLAQDLTEHVA